MKLSMLILTTAAIGVLAACSAEMPTEQGAAEPPDVTKKPHTLEMHGDTRVDDYYWLRERTDPEVLAYLEAENSYTEAVMASSRPLIGSPLS